MSKTWVEIFKLQISKGHVSHLNLDFIGTERNMRVVCNQAPTFPRLSYTLLNVNITYFSIERVLERQVNPQETDILDAQRKRFVFIFYYI